MSTEPTPIEHEPAAETCADYFDAAGHDALAQLGTVPGLSQPLQPPSLHVAQTPARYVRAVPLRHFRLSRMRMRHHRRGHLRQQT